MGYPRAVRATLAIALLLPLVGAPAAPEPQPTPGSGWPGSLRIGLPSELAGYESAPKDPYPDTDENGMGIYTQVSRRYQRIESATVARSLVLVVQDYGRGKDLTGAIRDATREAGKTSGFSAREQSIGGRPAFVVFHREGGKPVTVVTVIASPARLVLAVADNIDESETLKLVSKVDFQKIADAR
jgi:hypothetical protein